MYERLLKALTTLHSNGRSPAWYLVCVTKCRFNGNDCPHSWHSKGRARLCTRACVSKWCFSVNDFLQISHWKGRSVEWRTKWVLRQCLCAKSLPQCGQTWGRSPVWTRACVVKWCFSKNDLPHWAAILKETLISGVIEEKSGLNTYYTHTVAPLSAPNYLNSVPSHPFAQFSV